MSTDGEKAVTADQPTLQFAGKPDATLHFSGPPKSLTGQIPLVNTGSEKQKLRSFSVSGSNLQGAAGLPIGEVPLRTRLHGGQQASVLAEISLDPSTAPGKYDFQLIIGGKSVAATANVSPVVDLKIDPATVTILVGSSLSATRTLVVENAGNVALASGAVCEVALFDSYDLIGALIDGLHKANKETVESMVKSFLTEWSTLRVGTLSVKRPATTFLPKTKTSIEVEFVVSGDLKPLKRYRAALQLYNATLAIDIYTSAKVGSQNDSKEETQQTQ